LVGPSEPQVLSLAAAEKSPIIAPIADAHHGIYAEPDAPRPATPAPDTALQLASIPHYFKSEELTRQPIVKNDVRPDVDLTLTMDDIADRTLVLHLMISESGDIDRVDVEASGLSAAATDMVKKAFAQMKFRPGLIGNQVVKSQLTLEVSLDGATNSIGVTEQPPKILLMK
jgi:hypothetical protein